MRIIDQALRLLGSTSGETILRGATAASGTLTFPAGTTDFSASGPGVIKQASAGSAFAVAPVAVGEVTGAAPIASPTFTGTATAPSLSATASVNIYDQTSPTHYWALSSSSDVFSYYSSVAGTNVATLTTTGTLTIHASATVNSNVILQSARNWSINSMGATSAGQFWIYDSTAGQIRLVIDTSGGCQNTTGTWSAISDLRRKRDVAPYERGLAAIAALRPVSFRFIDDGDEEPLRQGLIAQEVEGVMPEIVGAVELDDGPAKTVDPGRAIYALINAVKGLAARVEALESKLAV